MSKAAPIYDESGQCEPWKNRVAAQLNLALGVAAELAASAPAGGLPAARILQVVQVVALRALVARVAAFEEVETLPR